MSQFLPPLKRVGFPATRVNSLKRVGRIINYTKSKLFVIELDLKILPGSYLLDGFKRKIAVVVDVIGPINKPYCIAKPLIGNPESLIGSEVYIFLEKRRKE